MVSHASESVMLFVDRLFLSRVSKVHLAAAMGGGVTNFMLMSLFVGIVGYVNAVVGQYYGSGQKDRCIVATVQSIYLSFIAFPLILAFLPLTQLFFQLFGLEAEQIALANTYLRILLSGSVMFILRNALTGFFTGIGRTKIVMVANLTAMIVNVPANYILIFGAFGMPALGIAGAAIGTLCGHFAALVMLGAAFFMKSRSPEYRGEKQWRIELGLVKKLLRFGGPAGIEAILNVAAFNFFVQMMHSYGSDVAAAVTIAFNWDLVSFIPMLGLGIATTAIVAQNIGAGDYEEARKSAYLVLRLSFLYTGSMMILFLTATRPMVLIFSAGFGEDTQSVSALAMVFLRLAALYLTADSTQLIFAGALRGAGDTAWVMRFSVIMHWLLAIVVFIAVRFLDILPVAVWCIFIAFVLLLGIFMFIRFKHGKWEKIKLIEETPATD